MDESGMEMQESNGIGRRMNCEWNGVENRQRNKRRI